MAAADPWPVVDWMRRLVARADAGALDDGTPAQVLAACRAYLADPATVDLNEAFGLRPIQGGSPWWEAERLAERDAAIVVALEQVAMATGARTPTEAARILAERIDRRPAARERMLDRPNGTDLPAALRAIVARGVDLPKHPDTLARIYGRAGRREGSIFASVEADDGSDRKEGAPCPSRATR